MARRLDAFDGDVIYVDTMLVVGQLVDFSQWHLAGRSLFARAAKDENPLSLVTASLTLDEVMFTLLTELVARPPHNVNQSRGPYLQRHPAVVRVLVANLVAPVRALNALLRLEPVLPEDVISMVETMAGTGLLPRDAIHLAVMRRLGISAIASDDDAFDGIEGITLYKP